MITAEEVLVGQRVTLRPYRAGFSEDELRALYRWAHDPKLLELSGGAPLGMRFERFRELFLAQLPRHNSAHEQLFLILDERRRAIGRTGLFGLNSGRTAELGIVIGEHDCWGKGYGRDTVRTLTEFGFRRLALERIVLYTFPENERARRAFEAAGFRYVRQLSRFSFERGTHSEIEMVREADDAPHPPHAASPTKTEPE